MDGLHHGVNFILRIGDSQMLHLSNIKICIKVVKNHLKKNLNECTVSGEFNTS